MLNRRPVSRSSVAMVPKLETTNWPSQQQLLDQPTFKDSFQQQNQAIMFQKFQDHSITKEPYMNEYDSNYMLNYNMMEPNHGLPRR